MENEEVATKHAPLDHASPDAPDRRAVDDERRTHSATTAYETLEFLWRNYHTLTVQVDLDFMPRDALEIHIKKHSLVRTFRISAWLARQGYYISAWNLWEYYSRSLCQALPCKERKKGDESTVDWVARSLTVNSKLFTDHAWFASANSVRNLIAHSGGRAVGSKGIELLTRARVAFPKIGTWQDGYLALEHEQMAELHLRIESFIRETA